MPDVPQVKKFPYDTGIQCKICHPGGEGEDPPNLRCLMERVRGGNVVHRSLECPNCGARNDDLYDLVTKTVVFNRTMDEEAARGPRRTRGGDIG